MNRTLNWSALVVPFASLVAVMLQSQAHVITDPTLKLILGAVLVGLNYIVHPTVPADNQPPSGPSTGKMAVILIFALALAGARSAKADTSDYGVATFMQRSHAFGVATVQVKNQFVHGNLSIDFKTMVGADFSGPQGAFGFAEIASYNAGHGWSAFAGLGIGLPFNRFRWSEVNRDNVGLVIGFHSPVDLSFLGLK